MFGIRGRYAAVVAALYSTAACTATQPVRVLPRGQSRWVASLGGPLLPNHAPTGFIPYLTAGRIWGQRDNLTLSANVHILPAAFGIAAVDAGVTRRLITQQGARPEITAQGQLYLFAGTGGARAYPNLATTASWTAGPRTLLYGGSAVTFRLNGGRAALVSPLVGVQRDAGRRFVLQLEGKWMAANVDMSRGLFEGENSMQGQGGIALQFGVQVKR